MEVASEISITGAKWAVKLLLEGNKEEVESKIDENLLVEAIMCIPEKGNATGTHTGKRMSKIKKYKFCGCLVPEYELHATGTGEFNGRDSEGEQVCYKGSFMDDKFNHVTLPPASIEIGNYMRYEGNFKDGLRHGPGTAFVWSTKMNDWWLIEKGQFKMDKLTDGRNFPESKPEKYMSYVGGRCEGEETRTPVPETVQAGGGAVIENRRIGDVGKDAELKNINFGDKVAKEYKPGQNIENNRILGNVEGKTGDINFGDGF